MLCGRDHLLRPRAQANVLGQIDPTHGAGLVDEDLRRPRDVVTLDARAFVKEIVAANDFRLRIGKKCECISALLLQVRRDLGSIYADGDRTNADCFKSCQVLFDTP